MKYMKHVFKTAETFGVSRRRGGVAVAWPVGAGRRRRH
jgi:hypothetical protein